MVTKEQAIAELNRRKAAQSGSLVGITPEQARAELARRKGDEGGFNFSMLNRGLAEGLGLPVDLAASGISKLTGIDIPEPMLGSRQLKNMMGNLVAPDDRKAVGLGDQVQEGIGSATGALLPMGGLAKGLSATTGAVGSLSKDMLAYAAKNPKLAGFLELLSGGGSGAGGYAAEQIAPDSPTAKLGGQVIGGVLAPMPVATKAIASAGRGIQKAIFPFTESGGRVRAADTLQSNVADPAAAAEKITLDSTLSPAVQTGERRLIGLENRIRQDDPVIDASLRENLSGFRQEVGSRLQQEGNIADTRAFIEQRTKALTDNVERMKNDAVARATASTEGIQTKLPSQISTDIKSNLDEAFSTAKAQENELWRQIPEDVQVSASATSKALREQKAKTPKAQADAAPTALVERLFFTDKPILDATGKPISSSTKQPVRELQGLRSELLERARAARADGKFNKARLHEDMADAILDDLGASAQNIKGDVGQALRSAMDFTKTVKQTFNQGAVGRVLKSAREGGERVPPETVLDSIIGAGKIKGDVGISQLLNATPESAGQVLQYVLSRLNQAAVRDGKLNTAAAERFIRNNQDIMQRFPQLDKQIKEAITYENDLQRIIKRQSSIQSGKGVSGRLLSSPMGKEADVIFSNTNPQKYAKDLLTSLKGNKEAIDGLKSSVSDYIFRKGSTDKFDDFGNEIISGRKIEKLLQEPRNSFAIKEVLGKDGLERVRGIAKELIKVEDIPQNMPARLIDDMPNKILTTMAQVLGAKVGASTAVGGASIQAANIGSNRAREFLQRITGDKAEQILKQATQDPQLYKTLLMDIRSPRQAKEAGRRFNAWLVSPAAEYLEDTE